jgi:hypothetical protein
MARKKHSILFRAAVEGLKLLAIVLALLIVVSLLLAPFGAFSATESLIRIALPSFFRLTLVLLSLLSVSGLYESFESLGEETGRRTFEWIVTIRNKKQHSRNKTNDHHLKKSIQKSSVLLLYSQLASKQTALFNGVAVILLVADWCTPDIYFHLPLSVKFYLNSSSIISDYFAFDY